MAQVGDDRSNRRRSPTRQPVRALVACLGYVAVVLAAFGLLSQLARPAMAILFTTGVAALLTVPLAVLAPAPRARSAHSVDARPLLQRERRTTR